MAFRNKNYHRSCFVCKGGCGIELGGTEFAIKNGECFCFGTVHFYGDPWIPDRVNNEQFLIVGVSQSDNEQDL